jgi:RNA polymerase subunit RPABC4/transcription elongation factor Spt4
MKLKKCPKCNIYTLKEICSKCGSKTKEVHYKFIKIKDAPKSSDSRKIRKN